MEDKKIKDICSRYPWTEETEAELSAMTKKARPMFRPRKSRRRPMKNFLAALKNLKTLQPDKTQARTEWGEFEKAFKENPF